MVRKIRLQNELELSLVLSQQLQQSLKILQMNCQELREFLTEELLQNPAADLKMLDISPDLIDISQAPGKMGNTVASLNHSHGQSLSDMLLDQIPMGLDRKTEEALRFLISNLDKRGYMPDDIVSIAANSRHEPADIGRALDMLRSMEPAGVGASDLKDCLALQLERLGGDRNLEKLIINEKLPELASGNIRHIADGLKRPYKEVLNAVSCIRQLNPIPANGLRSEEEPIYITPEVYISSENGVFTIKNSSYNSYEPEISPEFMDIMRENPDSEAAEYCKKQIADLRELRRAVGQRKSTIIKVTEEILKVQGDYLLGRTSYMQPLSLERAAEALGVAQSTVSRAIQGKYLMYEDKVYSYKSFFDRRLPKSKKTTPQSRSMLENMIDEIISAEDPEEPFSDQQLTELIRCRGVNTARRTVAKYREKLGIPVSYLRKKLKD